MIHDVMTHNVQNLHAILSGKGCVCIKYRSVVANVPTSVCVWIHS